MWKQKYETYNVEFNIRKNLKTKRPTEGYKTEQERQYAFKVMNVLSGLKQGQRTRVLTQALKINKV